jgi:4-aminobutyrate aminotransferase-like enzyme
MDDHSHASNLISRRTDALSCSYRLFYEEPFHPVRGEGVWLYDNAGKAYLDMYNNVPSVGHCHPKVSEALAAQATLLNTHTRYVHEIVIEYAETLLATLPGHIGQMVFTCTGSEANDLALRIAEHVTGGSGIVVTEAAYHGVTKAVAEISPALGLGIGDHVRTVAAPDAYRRGSDNLGALFAADVAAAFADLEAAGHKPAALIVDTIFSSDGIFADPAGFLQPASEAARTAGALVIADEVQAGFGRLGDAFWGFARHGIEPDIVTMGKPMGAGHPVAGLAARKELLDSFGAYSRYFNTYAGNPVSSAVGMAVLEVIKEEGMQEHALAVGSFLREGLLGLANKHQVIGDVRGAGLFIGVELVQDKLTKKPNTEYTANLVNEMRRRQILLSSDGPAENVLKLRPPLPFSFNNASRFLDQLDAALSIN